MFFFTTEINFENKKSSIVHNTYLFYIQTEKRRTHFSFYLLKLKKKKEIYNFQEYKTCGVFCDSYYCLSNCLGKIEQLLVDFVSEMFLLDISNNFFTKFI
eukprot:TRINITY_DN10759_c0_g1_i7.p7 TRINITY_DN10759_c0_g1~~TRINITY_DN10759_c0_g1_i7.p7  ORF type:complete len:100 (-),score=7.60 TRINITY_DN10759_c0_g1_i7:451-750(-)